jgi:hypothetical protein
MMPRGRPDRSGSPASSIRSTPAPLEHPRRADRSLPLPFAARFRGKFSSDSLSGVKKEGDVYRGLARHRLGPDVVVEDPESSTPVC